MSKKPLDPDPADRPHPPSLSVYPVPWKGYLVLSCRKCQKKLRRESNPGEAARLKKALKARSKRSASPLRLHVLQVPCLNLCPKGAVAVCTQLQLARGKCSLIRTSSDLDILHAQCRTEAGSG